MWPRLPERGDGKEGGAGGRGTGRFWKLWDGGGRGERGSWGIGKNQLWGCLDQVLALKGMKARDTWDPQFQATPGQAQSPAGEEFGEEIP